MRNWGMGTRGTLFFFIFNIGIRKSNKFSLVFTPLTSFRPMICDNSYPTHYPGDNLGNVADEYSKTPAVVGDHTLQWWPALNGCRSPKVHYPHLHRAEDDLPAGYHSVPQKLLHRLSSPAHLSFSYAFIPKGLESHYHRTPDALAVLAGWEARLFLCCLKQQARAVTTTGKKMLEITLVCLGS